MNQASDVVIIGGGAIGCASAYYCARRGLSVTLIDKPKRGRATSASAGGTWPLGESLGLGCGIIYYKTLLEQGHVPDGALGPEQLPDCFLDFSLQSNDMFPELAAALAERGFDCEFEETSLLYVLLEEADVLFAKALLSACPRDKALMEWLTPAELARAEPAVVSNTEGALRFKSDDQVNPYRFAESMREAARSFGATIISHTEVTGVVMEGNRVVAARTLHGDYPCKTLINAAGAWAPKIGDMVGVDIPVAPVRGQIVGTTTLPEVLNACLCTSDCYLAQKKHGEIIIGSTTEEVGFNHGTTPEAMTYLASSAVRVLPFLHNVEVKRVWSGFRPGSPDELPILGPADGIEGYLNACGHFRTGILNAPLTGLLLSEIIAGDQLSIDLQPFLLSRFADNPPAADWAIPDSSDLQVTQGGVGHSGGRAYTISNKAYLDNFFEWLRADRATLNRDIEQFKSYEFLDAVVAGCSMVAAADGTISASERNAMARFIRESDALRVFEMSEVMSRFDWFSEGYGFNVDEGDRDAVTAVEGLKSNRLAARVLVRLCCAIAASDGEFEREEVTAVRRICKTLELEPSEFRL